MCYTPASYAKPDDLALKAQLFKERKGTVSKYSLFHSQQKLSPCIYSLAHNMPLAPYPYYLTPTSSNSFEFI